MKMKMQAALIAAGAAMAGGLLLSGCQAGGREYAREEKSPAACEVKSVDGGTIDMPRRKVSKPLTKFDGVDFVSIRDSAPNR